MKKMLRGAAKSIWALLSPLTERLLEIGPIRKFVWRFVSQRGELAFHERNEWRRTEDFDQQTEALFRGWDLERDTFAGRRILDLGAGSKLRSRFFDGAEIIVIEPLADDYRKIDFCDLDDAAEVHSVPAEQDLPHLHGTVDFAMSINVLDHVFDPKAVVENVHRFLKPDGRFLLSVDLHGHDEADLMHPVSLSKQEIQNLLEAAGFNIERSIDGLPLAETDTYGHGKAYTVIAALR